MVPGNKAADPYTSLHILRSQEVITEPTGDQTTRFLGGVIRSQGMQLIVKAPGSVGKQEAGGGQPPEERTAKGVSGK